ncbi:class I SAM-dependent methyltransferase [Gracilimonas sp. BCB1]|uniref:class I SAM-dependent methyltransferase n=1 Tax=Gracilimonas sp. BCB1 TaxID=3152362 RepID=UPI0032D92FA6
MTFKKINRDRIIRFLKFSVHLFQVIYEKLTSGDKDYFLPFKYDHIQHYYGKDCLDIGAGTGRFSLYLQDQGHTITPIDVVDKAIEEIDLDIFDGQNINKADKSFSTSIFMFVLHHTDTQVELLKEAARVTRDYIIVAEDIVESRLDKMFGNIHLNTSPWAKGNNSFRSKKEWIELFSKLNLELVEINDIPIHIYPIYPVNRTIFVLKPI